MDSEKVERESYKEKFREKNDFFNNLLQPKTETSSLAEDTEEEIQINKFLDFIKVSCKVNNVVSMQTNQQRHLTCNTSENYHSDLPKDELNFEKMVDKEIFEGILGQRFENKIMKPNIVQDSEVSISGIDDNKQSQRRSTVGLAIGSFSRRSFKKLDSGLKKEESVQTKLYKKLDYVINEGMADSVLSFICPIPVPASFPNQLKHKQTNKKESINARQILLENTDSVKVNNNGKINDIENVNDRKGLNCETYPNDAKPMRKIKNTGDTKEPEIVIHVCDEVKNTTRDFSCSQRLLVNKMGYFAEVTAGQKLDEMDISVHCDIQIFDWLIKWMKLTDFVESSGCKKPTIEGSEDMPRLDANNVIPILVSAGFLQMEPLMVECLSFCHARLCDVVRCSLNLSCLNDSIITRLAAMFTNLELEMVRDKKERLVPRLWIKLIQSLCEPEPEALRGHSYSLAGLFRCSRCGEHLTNTIKSYIPCQPNNTRLTRWGQLTSCHVRDNLWNMNNFIAQIYKEHRSWRKVYWKLWGHCHFLYCCICESHFPVYKMAWCRFHPLSPNYMESITDDFLAGPVGRYPCCGQKAFRFETFPETNGCHFREHSVLAETDRERQILQIIQIISDNCILSDPPSESLRNPEKIPSWGGVPLTPQQCRQGLLPALDVGERSSKSIRHMEHDLSINYDSCSDSSASETTYNIDCQSKKNNTKNCEIDFSSDGCESEKAGSEALTRKKLKKKLSLNSGRNWFGELSARSNQDHQREYEEKALKNVVIQINKNYGLDKCILPCGSVGGFYVRLEAEWKDQLKHRTSSNPISSSSASAIGKHKYK
ncbi:SANT and BTB domain regulator of class switch recombination [Bactrocera dorsalis]|uniref:SANT and BTB domain regulator of class switch recombination n=1 Tax=Bactrocera dorsalis TaxID=27457 RepID=A0A6I9VGH3_BACDO|nr:SANT and BTB domain regulator of class switch recombination [Bactrocera dorsalis]